MRARPRRSASKVTWPRSDAASAARHLPASRSSRRSRSATSPTTRSRTSPAIRFRGGRSSARCGGRGKGRAISMAERRSRFTLLVVAAVLVGCSSGGVEDRGTGETPPPLEGTSAFVVTSDFQTGSFAVFPVLQPEAVARNVERIHSDAVARAHDGLVYVVNRLGGDNIQAIDPAAGYATRWQCSVDNGSNPHDIAFAAPDKAYVTLFVTLQLLDRRNFFRPTERSLLALVDVATDTVVGSIPLSGTNPFAESA